MTSAKTKIGHLAAAIKRIERSLACSYRARARRWRASPLVALAYLHARAFARCACAAPLHLCGICLLATLYWRGARVLRSSRARRKILSARAPRRTARTDKRIGVMVGAQ
jgi:hypothetical protein